MRKLVLVVVFTAVAAGCGGSSNSGGTPSGPVSGTIGGRAFSPAEARAVVVGTQAPCTIANQTLGVKAIAIELTSYANACADFQSPTCPARTSPQAVTILFARLNAVPPQTAPTIAPGTYQISTAITGALPDPSGNIGQLYLAFAEEAHDAAACANPPVTGGTLRLDQVSDAGPITGHVSVSFVGGGTISGDFSAPVCPGVTPDVCTLASAPALCALTPACGAQ